MNPNTSPWAIAAFAAVILGTFLAAWKGRRDAAADAEADITKQCLNRWLVGLSAGATANSGFVVTGAVGLGYAYGVYWLLLPLAWFAGDLVFWRFFPHRLNAYAARSSATTLSNLIGYGLKGRGARALTLICTVLVVVCMGGYTMAQWVAGQKFVDGAFGFSGRWVLVLFAVLIIVYSSLGRFRGSVYADTFQAITRLAGTFIALGAVCWAIGRDPTTFSSTIRSTDEGFFDVLGGGTLASALGFFLGYAAAALGFGLGQPQVTNRYFAARDPDEARAAKWIYIGYVQLTWVTMTVFGILLRGVMPELDDPEQGLTVFVAAALPSVLVGLIVGDIFGAIASTANSLLVAMAHAVRDLLGTRLPERVPLSVLTLALGLATMLVALAVAEQATVFDLAIASVSLLAAGLAPAVMAKVCGWRCTTASLTAAVVTGLLSAVAWRYTGMSSYINEAAIGIAIGMLANYVISRGAESRAGETPLVTQAEVGGAA